MSFGEDIEALSIRSIRDGLLNKKFSATEIAERAIAGLKLTVRDCDKTLGERLRTAERFVAEIDRQVGAGEDVLHRLTQIVAAARPGAAEPVMAPPPSVPDTSAVVKAAALARSDADFSPR